jgi:hypothetical protein
MSRVAFCYDRGLKAKHHDFHPWGFAFGDAPHVGRIRGVHLQRYQGLAVA